MSKDYEVGYGRPPKHTQFTKGRSGNPRGRPKGTRNLKTDLIAELGERILVREGERTRSVSKQRGVVKTVVARTLKGDVSSAKLLVSMMMHLLDTGEVADELEAPLDSDDRAILERFVETNLVSKPAGAELRKERSDEEPASKDEPPPRPGRTRLKRTKFKRKER